MSDSHASGGANFFAGDNSTDVSGNTGWVFQTPPSITTSSASSITSASANLRGTIDIFGGYSPLSVTFNYATDAYYTSHIDTYSDTTTAQSYNTQAVPITVQGQIYYLYSNTEYHYQMQVTWVQAGITIYEYGSDVTFTTGGGGSGGGGNQYYSGGTGNLIAPNQNGNNIDVAPPIGGQNENTGIPSNAFTTLIHALSSVINLAGSPYTLPEQLIWLILATMVILGCMALSLMYLPNQIIGGVVSIGLSIVFWKMHIYPFAMVLFIVVGCIAVITWERKPSL
jgi:hypothetical protein